MTGTVVEASLPLTVSVPASTSNLGSGFDTLSAALAVRLECLVRARTGPEVVWSGAPEGGDNIARTALEIGCEHLEIEAAGLQIEMTNPIPLARGMGSSGAAIIAGLTIAQCLAGRSLPAAEVLELACPLEGHPDNLAASLLGGWVLCCGTDDGVLAERIPGRIPGRFVLAVPEVEISTRRAREILPREVPLADAIFNQQRCALLVHALAANRPELLVEATRDRLHQPHRAGLIPGADRLLSRERWPQQLKDALLSVTISGSGSTIAAFVRGQEAAVGRWLVEQLAAAGTAARAIVAEIDPEGVAVRKSS